AAPSQSRFRSDARLNDEDESSATVMDDLSAHRIVGVMHDMTAHHSANHKIAKAVSFTTPLPSINTYLREARRYFRTSYRRAGARVLPSRFARRAMTQAPVQRRTSIPELLAPA